MRHAFDADIIDRLKTNLDEGRRDVSESVRTRSPDVYRDPERYKRELDLLFRDRPLLAGHVSRVRRPGDFFTTNMLGLPLLITRDENGQLNAFVNACLHRGSRIEALPCGTRTDFICPYHGWSYGLDGGLRHVTDAAAFEGLDLTDARLVRVPVAEANGLVFVRPRPRDEAPLAVDLGEIGEQLDYFGVADHAHFRTISLDLKFNWKIAIDGSLENYHFNHLHRAAARIFTGMASLFDFYGPNCRFVTAGRSIKAMGPADLPAARAREQSMVTYHLFPNGFVNTVPDHLVIQYYLPTGLDTCTMTWSLLIPPDADAQAAEHWEKTWGFGQNVMGEDYQIMEGIQRAYSAGFDSPAINGRYEHAVARFHDLCDAALAGTLGA